MKETLQRQRGETVPLLFPHIWSALLTLTFLSVNLRLRFVFEQINTSPRCWHAIVVRKQPFFTSPQRLSRATETSEMDFNLIIRVTKLADCTSSIWWVSELPLTAYLWLFVYFVSSVQVTLKLWGRLCLQVIISRLRPLSHFHIYNKHFLKGAICETWLAF